MTSNYLLPEGNVQIAFSGGRTSGFMLYKILEANNGLPDRAKVIFTNKAIKNAIIVSFFIL